MRFGTTWRADGLLREGVILSHWRGQRWKRCRHVAYGLWRQFAGHLVQKCPIAGPDPGTRKRSVVRSACQLRQPTINVQLRPFQLTWPATH
jgi:hypothetical protein